MSSPQIDKAFKIHQLLFPREGKRLLGTVRGYNGASKTKTTKLLEASDLRAFNKYYIIGNKQFINKIDGFMYCYGRA